MEITKQTRAESYRRRPARMNEILTIMGDKEMTARQILNASKYKDMNAIRPRLTELKALGKIEAVGKAYDKATNRSVAVFKVVS